MSTGNAGMGDGRTEVKAVQFAMGTAITHVAFGRRAEAAVRDGQAEVERLEDLLSRFRPGSEISRINRSAGTGAVQVSRDTFEVLTAAVHWSVVCEGLFDVTIGPLVALWQRAAAEERPPRKPDIDRALALVGYRDLVLDPGRRTANLRREGQSIDVGGIGKGYAGDKLLEVFRRHGVESGLVNLGGNVVSLGTKPDGMPWRVGIRHPREEEAILGFVQVTGQTVVTSGDYQRLFVDGEGRRHHHILNPATGHPAASGLSSVTIVAGNSCAADALSTAVFVAGMTRGLGLLRGQPGVEAVLVDMESRVYVTRGLRDGFQAADGIDVAVVD